MSFSTTPKGPKGQKRPTYAVGNAIKAVRIAAGEGEEECEKVVDGGNVA